MDVKDLLQVVNEQEIYLFLQDGKLKFKAKPGAMNAQIKGLLGQYKVEIIDLLSRKSQVDDAKALSNLKPSNLSRAPLSHAQQRLWMLDQLNGKSTEYNLPTVFEVSGCLDLTVTNKVMNEIIQRHHILRTNYITEAGEPLQYVRTDVVFELECHDVSELDEEKQTLKIKSILDKDFKKPFNLASDLMIRGVYIGGSESAGVLALNIHHIASDGWSVKLLMQEFSVLYHAFSHGHSSPLKPLQLQYIDYAHWQSENLSEQKLQVQQDYWRTQLADVKKLHDLPIDFTRPRVKSNRGATVESSISGSACKAFHEVAKQFNLTPFMLFHALFAVFIARFSNSNDTIVGTPVADRKHEDLEPVVGFFVNTLPLRVQVAGQTVAEYFEMVRATHIDGQSHLDIPFEQLVEMLGIPHEQSFSPLFQIMLTTNTNYGLQSNPPTESSFTGPSIKPLKSAVATTVKFDLEVEFNDFQDTAQINWKFDTALFTESKIKQFSGYLITLINNLSLVNLREQALNNLMLLDVSEQVEHLQSQKVKQSPNAQRCFHELFEAQAIETPHAIALEFQGKYISYEELNLRSSQLAKYLNECLNVKPTESVIISARRSTDLVIAILGVLKAGGAYVPIAVDQPISRADYVAQSVGAVAVLCDQFGAQLFSDLDCPVELLEQQNYLGVKVDAFSAVEVCTAQAAYTLFTSGSTGKPKGVTVSNQALASYLTAAQETYWHDDLVASVVSTSINFDATLTSLLVPLISGGFVKLVEEGPDEISKLYALIKNTNENLLFKLTPSHLNAMKPFLEGSCDGFPQVQHCVVVGGEQLTYNCIAPWVRNAFSNALIFNEYGPTEATVGCCVYRLNNAQLPDDIVPIGKPLCNTALYVLDKHQAMLPYGAIGELYIGGNALADGYLNNPEQTQKQFITTPDSLTAEAGSVAKLYKTGDLVRYLQDGNLEFIERIDEQIKINGYRIEISEIENKLNLLEYIDSAIVTCTKSQSDEYKLTAYVKLGLMRETTLNDRAWGKIIRQDLSYVLPQYMLPNQIIEVEGWPLTLNGKVDYKNLPDFAKKQFEVEMEPPSSDMEIKLSAIWSDILGLKPSKIFRNISFFELGGSSLGLIKLLKKIEDELLYDISMQDIYQNITIQLLAEKLEGSEQQKGRELEIVQLSKAENGRNLFIFPPFLANSHCYTHLAEYFSGTLNIYGVNVVHDEAPVMRFTNVVEIAKHYLEAIKQVCPNGPYYLAGWSMGGLLAYYVAILLKYQGSDVLSVTMLDSVQPEQFVNVSYIDGLKSSIRNVLKGNKQDFEQFEQIIDSAPSNDEALRQVVTALMKTGEQRYNTVNDLQKHIEFSVHYSMAQKPKLPLSKDIKVQLVVPLHRADKESYIEDWKSISNAQMEVFETPSGHWDLVSYQYAGLVAKVIDKGMAKK
ncbi:amino acid adenylation domain-containing protein [Pseudoalteromonas umbrosa]|uniref:amino acid adenylation domain-containing protein n=1 Tax=Pseudoalteromonas umbrosa TaxID=3048489 RepID=UPI0024C294BB|nr:amino acid adenylation domain-containing protein [Pseudoalteromonas sp. B95]MDK1287006.1 amino acid adenylation domain-containing protein [Pseudoalteromonas sp. B95]